MLNSLARTYSSISIFSKFWFTQWSVLGKEEMGKQSNSWVDPEIWDVTWLSLIHSFIHPAESQDPHVRSVLTVHVRSKGHSDD